MTGLERLTLDLADAVVPWLSRARIDPAVTEAEFLALQKAVEAVENTRDPRTSGLATRNRHLIAAYYAAEDPQENCHLTRDLSKTFYLGTSRVCEIRKRWLYLAARELIHLRSKKHDRSSPDPAVSGEPAGDVRESEATSTAPPAARHS